MMSHFLGSFQRFALEQLPLLIAYAVGIALALARWRQHPRTSLLTILACGIFLGSFVAYGLIRMLPYYSISLRFVKATFETVGIGLLFAAVFGRRENDQQNV
jgi:hypothetical protein